SRGGGPARGCTSPCAGTWTEPTACGEARSCSGASILEGRHLLPRPLIHGPRGSVAVHNRASRGEAKKKFAFIAPYSQVPNSRRPYLPTENQRNPLSPNSTALQSSRIHMSHESRSARIWAVPFAPQPTEVNPNGGDLGHYHARGSSCPQCGRRPRRTHPTLSPASVVLACRPQCGQQLQPSLIARLRA